MGKKREPSISDAVTNFKDIMSRGEITEFINENRVILSANSKGRTVIIIPDENLWNALMEDADFKAHVRALDISKQEDRELQQKFIYAEESEKDGWLDIDVEKFYKGEALKVTIDRFSYDISFNKDHLPVKLKKSEFDQLQYKIIITPSLTLGIKKKFDTKGVEGGGFVMLNFYQII